jgi:hypothetical protein
MNSVPLKSLFLALSRHCLKEAWRHPSRYIQHVKDAAAWLVLAVQTDPAIMFPEGWQVDEDRDPPVNVHLPYDVHA